MFARLQSIRRTTKEKFISEKKVKELCINFLITHAEHDGSTYEEYPHRDTIFIDYKTIENISKLAEIYWEEIDLRPKSWEPSFFLGDIDEKRCLHYTSVLNKTRFDRFCIEMQVVLYELYLTDHEKYSTLVREYLTEYKSHVIDYDDHEIHEQEKSLN